MNYEAPEDGADRSQRLDQARAVYASIFKALQNSLAAFESGDESVSDARHRQDLYRMHMKQLQSVFELEGSLDTFGQSTAASRIDLDAARAEIRERLSRFRQRGGS